MISEVPSIPNHSVTLCGDLEIKNKKKTKPVKLLCLYLISDKHFQNTFANPFLKSSITIFCETLSGVRLQHALHREKTGWGRITPVAGALRSDFGALSSVPGLPGSPKVPQFGSELGVCSRGARLSGSSAAHPALPRCCFPSLHTSFITKKKKKKGENPQIRLTVELSLPFLRTIAKLTHRWFFLASLFFDDVFSTLSIKLKYCLPGITAHQVLYYRWN